VANFELRDGLQAVTRLESDFAYEGSSMDSLPQIKDIYGDDLQFSN
jgi:hypothetical protein